jgi:hypothetical protein
MAIACFRLFTLAVPFLPDFKVPFLRLCIAPLTLFCAAFPYFRGMSNLQGLSHKYWLQCGDQSLRFRHGAGSIEFLV